MDNSNVYLCQQTKLLVKNLLELAQIFARKSRRASNSLICLDLINAMETMQISPRENPMKTIYYLRHFQALHNIPPYNYQHLDPRLSPTGERQAKKTIEILSNLLPIDLIVCSPLSRTLETYLLLQLTSSPLIIHPDLQEVCREPCDVGRPIDELKRDFPSLNEQLETFRQTFGDEHWREKTRLDSFYHPDRIEERARRIRQWLIDRPEQRILVISHNLMIKSLFKLDNEHVDVKNGEIQIKTYER